MEGKFSKNDYHYGSGVCRITRLRQEDIPDLLFQILNLVANLKDNDLFTLPDYRDYILENAEWCGLYGGFINDKLVGYAHIERPHTLDNYTAYLCVAVSLPQTPKEINEMILLNCIDWAKSKGAKRIVMRTKRNPKAITKRWGFNSIGIIDDSYLMSKPL